LCPYLLLIRSTIAASTVRPGRQREGGRDPGMSLDRSTKLGRYEILEPIGAGGVGEVYNALDTHLNRSVTGRQALRSSFIAGCDRAPAHDTFAFLLNIFEQLQRRVLAEGSRAEHGTLAAD